jgi:hypothetical protein
MLWNTLVHYVGFDAPRTDHFVKVNLSGGKVNLSNHQRILGALVGEKQSFSDGKVNLSNHQRNLGQSLR